MKNALPNTHHAPTLRRPRITHHVSRSYPLIILLALLLLFFHKMAFSNLILARGDTFLYFYPYWQAAAEALRHGRLPLWNPHLFMGAPFLANSQVGFFYPLNWPLWLLLPTPYAVSASILLHLFIAGWGTYLLGRRALSLSGPAALLAAVLFALGGYLTAQVEHVNQLQGLAWLPWLLWRLEIREWRLEIGDWRLGVRDWGLRGLRVAAAVGILLALQLLAGHTQTTFITGVAILLWLLAQLLTQYPTGPRQYAIQNTQDTLNNSQPQSSFTHHAPTLRRPRNHASRITHHVSHFTHHAYSPSSPASSWPCSSPPSSSYLPWSWRNCRAARVGWRLMKFFPSRYTLSCWRDPCSPAMGSRCLANTSPFYRLRRWCWLLSAPGNGAAALAS